MVIIGFNSGGVGSMETMVGHGSAAAIVVDGRVVAAAAEERFTRQKHTSVFPAQAIRYCLSQAEVRLPEVDACCFYWSPDLDRRNISLANSDPTLIASRHSLRLVLHERVADSFVTHFNHAVADGKLRYVPHHLCHAASAYHCANVDNAAYLVMDAYGEMVSISYGKVSAGEFEPIWESLLPTSLGVLYGDLTRVIGFTGREDEYKVMGLAAYGDPARFRSLFRRLWRATETGIEGIADRDSRDALLEICRFRRFPGDSLTRDQEDIAAALQECLEQQMLHLGAVVRRRTGNEHLCMAGGVALNAAAAGKLSRAGIFASISIQPAAHDAGTSLGAALYEHYRHTRRRGATPFSVYLGPEFSDDAMAAAGRAFDAEVRCAPAADLVREAARRLAGGQILGWFQGRMEFGPRALGNRSILADPRDARTRDRVNEAVKHREPFRPFAPAAMVEHAREYFELDPLIESPYMLFTVPVRPEVRHKVPAIVHQDNTARVQTVSKQQNPLFWSLLDAFYEQTGVPVLLNTSFNVNGEPIVCTPEDAVNCFLSTNMDALVLGSRLFERRALHVADLADRRPRLNDGVSVHADPVSRDGAGLEWRAAVVTWRHIAVPLEDDELTFLLACDGRRTVGELIEELSDVMPRDEAETIAIDLLGRFVRARFVRL